MARSTIYTIDRTGSLTAMEPSEPRTEDFMQDLIARHPQIIADQDSPLLLIRREHPIADREDGSSRWSLDHLFVTSDGVPVLVELKRAVDTRLRREIVGQMLDYAANGVGYWQAGRIAEAFASSMEKQGRDAQVELMNFLGPAADPETFWQQVDANFSAGRIRMVFVADVIPRELARIVEFLNEQMKADVRAVELAWFEGANGFTTLAPRMIGETERAKTTKVARNALPAVSRDDWIERHIAPYGLAAVDGAAAFANLVEELGGVADVTSTQASLYAAFETPKGHLYPISLSKYGKGTLQLCLGYLASRPAFATEASRRVIYDRVSEFAGPLSTRNLSGFPNFPIKKLNEPAVRAELAAIVSEIVRAARRPTEVGELEH
jgi:hypothetical protein